MADDQASMLSVATLYLACVAFKIPHDMHVVLPDFHTHAIGLKGHICENYLQWGTEVKNIKIWQPAQKYP